MTGLQAGVLAEYCGIAVEGLSLSGIRTALSLPQYGISFDVAQGYPFTLRMKKFFISHGHLDHAAGIPYILSQKAMLSEASPIFYMPPSLIEPMTEMIRLWEKIEAHQYQFQFAPLMAGEKIELNPQAFIKPFRTKHRIESFGFTLFSRNKKLKPEFSQLAGSELQKLKQNGIEIHHLIETPEITFTGDTQIEFLDSEDWIRKSKVLICETTYLDNRKSIEHAKKWGHTHLDELIPELDKIESEKIVLIHLSSRYSMHEAQKILQQKIPAKHLSRIEIFPGR